MQSNCKALDAAPVMHERQCAVTLNDVLSFIGRARMVQIRAIQLAMIARIETIPWKEVSYGR